MHEHTHANFAHACVPDTHASMQCTCHAVSDKLPDGEGGGTVAAAGCVLLTLESQSSRASELWMIPEKEQGVTRKREFVGPMRLSVRRTESGALARQTKACHRLVVAILAVQWH